MLFLNDFNESTIFSADFPKKKVSWKFVKWEMSHVKQTDMMQVRVDFHNFTYVSNYRVHFYEIFNDCLVLQKKHNI